MVTSDVVDVSVVFVTYNRSHLLKQTVESLRAALDKIDWSYEIVIADDSSCEPHRSEIRSLRDVVIASTPRNLGLGTNANNGVARSRGRYVFQVQDDWKFDGNPAKLAAALDFLKSNSDVGIVQLTPVGTDLDFERRTWNGERFRVFRNDLLPWRRRGSVRPYSDNPHIKRRAFLEVVGPYLETVPMTVCENDYKKRVAGQRKWKVAMLEGAACFVHLGTEYSLNPGGRTHPVVGLLHRFPIGRKILEPGLREAAHRLDHWAARIIGRFG